MANTKAPSKKELIKEHTRQMYLYTTAIASVLILMTIFNICVTYELKSYTQHTDSLIKNYQSKNDRLVVEREYNYFCLLHSNRDILKGLDLETYNHLKLFYIPQE
jgi:hypothetical protein